jgi:hypothetical protein
VLLEGAAEPPALAVDTVDAPLVVKTAPVSVS